MIQISALKTQYRNFKQDISDVSNSLFLNWCNYIIGFIYDKLASSTPDKFFKTQTIQILNGQSTYSLPSDFRDMARIGAGLYPTDSNGGPTDSPLPLTGYGSGSNGYYLDNGNLVITKIPQATTVYILRYIPLAPVFTNDTEYFSSDKTQNGVPLFRDEDIEYLIRAIDVQYEMWDEDPSLESIADQRFVRILSELLERQRSTPNSYNLSDYNWAY